MKIVENSDKIPCAAPYLILAINPGSTSTKVAVFENDKEVLSSTIIHSSEHLKPFKTIADQIELRLPLIRQFLLDSDFSLSRLSAVVGRGGLLRPIESGVYRVNQKMLEELRSGIYGEHASNLGAILAESIAREAGCAAYIADPVVVDEMDDVARLSGLPELPRRCVFHALNQKSAGREAAKSMNRKYEECNLIVAHLGGGISVGAHCKGRIIDVNNAVEGDGPFSPERSGSVPCIPLIELCFKGNFTLAQMKKKIAGAGGLVAYCGSNSLIELRKSAEAGDTKSQLVYDALIYQISQEIAKHGATLKGKIDCIVITGGMAHESDLTQKISDRVGFLAPIMIIPGEREMISLSAGVIRVLNNTEQLKEYL
jgi:butyrate kinase